MFVKYCDVGYAFGWSGPCQYAYDLDINMGIPTRSDIVDKGILYSDYMVCYIDNGVFVERCLSTFASCYKFCIPSKNTDV
ncbi:MAG: hypothetical protein J6U54_20875 [Clostridiales bacterium]|nr:hypothetical protein [Clostridiales bacterium]